MSCHTCLSCNYGGMRQNKRIKCLQMRQLGSRLCLNRLLHRGKMDRYTVRCKSVGSFAHYTLAEASSSQQIVVIASGLIGVGLFVVGLRAFCYSQLTYVTASMLANSLPKTDLRIVQVGGGIKELYYYPSTTVQVTVMDEEAKEGLLQEAGVQAGVPVLCRKEPINALGRMVTSSADAIVLLSTLQDVQDMSSFLKDCHAVLKPGGRLIFIQPVKDGEAASPLQSLIGSATRALDLNKLDPLKGNGLFRDVQWDFSNESIDPHIVGFAVAAE